ncbi:MAG TPA: protein kinase [Rhodanobacteraceae bacterium]|nr:protein kinase [Rhodanobacteraceae bacterium]
MPTWTLLRAPPAMPEVDARLAPLLRAALDLPASEQAAFIQRECAADAGLRRQLERLLDLDRSASLPLDVPLDALAANLLGADDEDAPDELTGSRIGPYRLIEVLGKGGMGAVWLAERADGEFEQQVALKLIRLGMDSEHVKRQFRHERELLARLRHPNIAALIDGGLDDRGRPWFAMERVEGRPLGAWVRDRHPDLPARLQLFAKLCLAVAHAHQHLIVHRDLKPSNVLVQADGEPRLLDFGIAKLVEQEGGEHTATQHRFLTRDFAAPEQLRGEPAGTSTDVYALGLILFELLTGARYRKLDKSGGEITLRPSMVLAGDASGNTAPAGIARGDLRGDLDAIVMHALALDPERRYPGAQQLADDVRRYLDGKPIEARPDSFVYRASKFVRRNRAAMVVGALGVLGLLLASGVAITQAVQKTAEAERARVALRQSETVRDFTTSIFLEADPARAKGAETTVGEVLAAARQRVAKDLASEPEVAAQLLDQIGNTYVSLGEDSLARATLAQALVFNQRAQRPSLTIAASAGGRLAYYRYQDGDAAAALGELDALIERLQATADRDAETIAQLAKMHEFKGTILYASGNKEAARAASKAAVATWRRVRGDYASAYLFAAVGLSDLDAALGHGEDALKGAEEVLADPLLNSKDVPPALLANARGVRVRALQALGRHAEAEPLLREVIAEFGAQYGPGAAMTRYWRYRYAETLHALGRLHEAQSVADAVLALPPDGTAAYRRIRVQVLAAEIARDRHAGDAASRIATATTDACGKDGNADLCAKARVLAAPDAPVQGEAE